MKRKPKHKKWDKTDQKARMEGEAIKKMSELRPNKIGASHKSIIRNTAVRIGQIVQGPITLGADRVFTSHNDDGITFITIYSENQFAKA